MKKLVSVMLAVVMIASCVFALSGCGRAENKKMDIVLITDGATITDGGYNQSAWKGVKSYAESNNLNCRYYQPSRDVNGDLTVETIGQYIDLAVNDGAEYIVLPGEDFAVSAYEIAPTYKDIKFILVDALPHSKSDKTLRLQQNVMCVSFDNLQAGFLAGYTSVIDGFNKLGYFGSVSSNTSGNYGAGFVQGAAYAADKLSKPVLLDYADYDSALLDYDYSFTIKAEYEKVPTDSKTKYFTVKVENGLGSGTYAEGENVTITANEPEEGKVFDHWELKSNTDGVKDSKVNVSSKKKRTMNLLVEKCDCTITAVYSDTDTATISVEYVADTAKTDKYYVPVNTDATVTAPSAQPGMVFDHWETADEAIIADTESKTTVVAVGNEDIVLTPVYVASNTPTFNVIVENGTGSGSYLAGDYVNLVADAPEEGYMFSKWSNVDNQGLSTGISMGNEYNYTTGFEMVDRYASIVEAMYDKGAQIIFGGGNQISDSIFSATWSFDYPVYAFGAGVDEGRKGNCHASVVNDYGNAVELALNNYRGASIIKADCSNGCIYVTNKTDESDKDYLAVYNELAENKIKLVNVQSGGDVRKAFKSKCLTLNYWIIEE